MGMRQTTEPKMRTAFGLVIVFESPTDISMVIGRRVYPPYSTRKKRSGNKEGTHAAKNIK